MRRIKEIMRSSAVLNSEGIHIGGSDRESNHHYGDAYELLFMEEVFNEVQITKYRKEWMPERRSTRQNVRLMMEVGVADGSCLLAWREIFPNATIVGMDIHHSDKAHGERIEFHIGDATNRADCERAAAGRQFDMIVDDATHHQKDLLRTLLYLWPSVKPGGLYVVEEFEDCAGLRHNIRELWPFAEIVGTCGPHVEDEPLIVFRKPL